MTPRGAERADVLIAGETVLRVGSDPGVTAETVIDAAGCLVGPGLVDLHTHLREPGHTWKEDTVSGSRSAAAGGYTALVAMPNTTPPVDRVERVEEVRRRAEAVGLVEVGVAAAVTKLRSGAELADLEALYEAGVRLFTDDGDAVGDPDLLEDAMRRISRFGDAVLAQHAEDPVLTAGRHLHDGPAATATGLAGMPAEAESAVVARDIEVCRRTRSRYHCQHVSSRETVEMLRQAKSEGLPVTAEVTPHHLTFDDSAVMGLNPDFKMYPPLRGEADRQALRDALIDGTIDAVATDHAPHSPAEKSVPFTEAPRGVIGLETAVGAVLEVLSDPIVFFERMSITPAQIAGMGDQGRWVEPGAPANIVVIDPGVRWTVADLASKARNSPYLGRTLTGRAVTTIHRGVMTAGAVHV